MPFPFTRNGATMLPVRLHRFGAFVVVVTLVVGCSSSTPGTSPATTSRPTSATTVGARSSSTVVVETTHYSGGLVSLDYPNTWYALDSTLAGSRYTYLFFLGTLAMHSCSSPSCPWPSTDLVPGAVLVTVAEFDVVPWQPSATPNTTIAGRAATVTVKRPGDCGHQADETIEAVIPVPRPGTYTSDYSITACLRAPGTAANERLVTRLLDSVQINDLPAG
jgi:hypothetical protein